MWLVEYDADEGDEILPMWGHERTRYRRGPRLLLTLRAAKGMSLRRRLAWIRIPRKKRDRAYRSCRF
ncbi:putative protein [Pseudozyma hubeiensis SY62]|uniref:Uncharacterized protein n=1 Tax=Pseudozyma hubeiensis (strain SY62) TaxID=1305764 RepID=R9NVJ6_PSEHS|nr:putative protein [Pseudozyma hubeiensis SY62]GAC92488.1 putative protein [Pseudozyma hubeiensis SY62]